MSIHHLFPKVHISMMFPRSPIPNCPHFPLQITRLEKTWTVLRHQYTQTAILYEKQLKPFSKLLHEGRGEPRWGL